MLIRLAGSNIRIWSNKSFSWCTFLRWSSGSRWHPIKSANRSLVGLMVLITVTFSYKYKNGNLEVVHNAQNPLALLQSVRSNFASEFSPICLAVPFVITWPHKSSSGHRKRVELTLTGVGQAAPFAKSRCNQNIKVPHGKVSYLTTNSVTPNKHSVYILINTLKLDILSKMKAECLLLVI